MVDKAESSTRPNRGGRRAATGFDFQARVGAWLAAQMLAGTSASSLQGLAEHSVIERIAFETGDAIDDIRVDSRSPSGRTRFWMQAKRNITISARPAGALAGAVAQCLAAFPEHADDGSLFYVVCSAESRRAIQQLERARVSADDSSHLSRDAQRARMVLSSLGAHDALLARLRFLALDVEDAGSDCQRAQDLFGMGVLLPGQSPRAAWSALVTECLKLIAQGVSADVDDMRVCLSRAGLAAAPSSTAQFRERVSHAIASVQRLYSSAPPFVCPVAANASGFVADFAHRVVAGEDLEFLAGSGAGKSLLLRHLALALAARDRVPLLLVVGSLSSAPAQWVVEATQLVGLTVGDVHRLAEERRLVLLIDGTNDLAPTHRESMRGHLLAWKDRGACVVACGHEPADVGAASITALETYDVNARRSLLGLTSERPNRVEQSILDTFRRPFDLTVARACLADLPEGPSLYDVFDAYVTSRLVDAGVPRADHLVVDAIALGLAREVHTSLSLDEALRFCSGHASLERLASAGILELIRARVLFAHETLRNFCAARALLSASATATDLAAQCSTPALSILAPFVFQGIRNDETRRAAAEACDALRSVALDAAHGRMGARLAAWMRIECHAAVGVAINSLETLRVTVRSADSTNAKKPIRTVVAQTERRPSVWQRTCLRIVGSLSSVEAYWPMMRELIGVTEAVLGHELVEQDIDRRAGLNWVLGFRGTMSNIGAVESIGGAAESYGLPAGRAFTATLAEPSLPLGVRHVLLLLVRNAIREGALNPAESWTHLLPGFLMETWRIGMPHSRHEIREIVQALAQQHDTVDTSALRDWVGTLDGGGSLFLNSLIVEMADAFGDVAPYQETQDVISHAREVLGQPADPLAQAMAFGIVAGRFEEVIGTVHDEAFDSLNNDERAALLAMALLSAEGSFTTDFLVQELVVIPAVNRCELAVAAFTRWFTAPEPTSFMFSSSVSAFCAAACGLAKLRLPLPQTGATESERAWPAIARAMFLPDDSDEARSVWRSTTQHSVQWMPVFEWIVAGFSQFRDGIRAHAPDCMRHREAFAMILEECLPNVRQWERYCATNSCGVTAISLARVLGGSSLEILVRRLVDDPLLGPHAVDALRHWGVGTVLPYPFDSRMLRLQQ